MNIMTVNIIIRVVNILIVALELALLLRVLLPWFRVPESHPAMRFLIVATEPILRPIRQALGRRSFRWSGRAAVDMAPLVAFFALWFIQALFPRILYLIIAPPLWLFRPGADPGRWIQGVLNFLFQAYNFMLLLRILMEWIQVSYTHPVMRFLWDITEPLLAPIRRRLPIIAGLDFSPLVAVLLLSVVQMLVNSLLTLIF